MRRGYLDAVAWLDVSGVGAQLEAGRRVSESLSWHAFARAQADWRGNAGVAAGVGVRW